MKNKIIYVLVLLFIIAMAFFAKPAFAEVQPSLLFSAVNAGYKDELSSQNYDFVELVKTVDGELDLSDYSINYYNSNNNASGTFLFENGASLQTETLVIGYAKSPQYQELPDAYLYTFSSSGLASTAGRLELVHNTDVIDELCWGKITCAHQVEKFSTSSSNRTAKRCLNDDCETDYYYESYYPEIDESAIVMPPPPAQKYCTGLSFSEVYSYYESDASEQFIELYNSTDSDIDLSACSLEYKNKTKNLEGILSPNAYIIIRDFTLTKNPTTSVIISLRDDSGVIDSFAHMNGQKRGAAMALIGDE